MPKYFNRNRITSKIIIAFMIICFAKSFITTTAIADKKLQLKYVGLYEYWNPKIKDHKYTINHQNNLPSGYKFKRYVCKVSKAESKNNTPFLEYWNQLFNDHYYAASWLGLSFGDCHYQTIACYVEKTKNNFNKPLHEYWNQKIGDHYYTTTFKGEIFDGYEYSGIACYVR